MLLYFIFIAVCNTAADYVGIRFDGFFIHSFKHIEVCKIIAVNKGKILSSCMT